MQNLQSVRRSRGRDDGPVGVPAGRCGGPDPDAFLSDVLTGWRRAQLAQNFSPDTARRRVASVLRMGDFVDSAAYPCSASTKSMASSTADRTRDVRPPGRTVPGAAVECPSAITQPPVVFTGLVCALSKMT